MSEESGAGPPDSGGGQGQNLEGVSILTWSADNVKAWLKKEDYSKCIDSLAELNGKRLAKARIETLTTYLGNKAVAMDLWEAVGILLRKQQKKNLFEDYDEYEIIMDTRGTPVQSAAAPANDVFKISAKFPKNVQTTRGARAAVYREMVNNNAMRLVGEKYIYYDEDNTSQNESPNADIALLVKVYALGFMHAQQLQRVFADWKHHPNFYTVSQPENIELKKVQIPQEQQLIITKLEDYDPAECVASACQGINETASVLSSTIVTVATDSPLSKFQAIDVPQPGLPHQRLHLINRYLIEKNEKLDNFPQEFWTLARQTFDISKQDIQTILEMYGKKLNQNESNFIAGTYQFHNLFDGLQSKKIFVGNRLKTRRVELGSGCILLSPINTRKGNSHAASEVDRRDEVFVRVQFLNDEGANMYNRITSTDTQPAQTPPGKDENGRNVIIKSFRVEDSELFCKALRFKAAITFAAYKARLDEFNGFIDMLNSLGE